MATSPSKPEFGLPLKSQTSGAARGDNPDEAGVSPAPGQNALQALLAFSSLHQQIRQRRSQGGSPAVIGSPDEFAFYEVLQCVAERALALTGADGVAIALVQEGAIICRAATGPIAPEIGIRLDPNSGFSGLCFRGGEIVRCDDVESDLRVNLDASRRLNARSMVAIPLRGRHSVVGLLEALSTDAFGFNDSDVRSLKLLAELIIGALKPDEEEKLEAQSPVLIAPASKPKVAPAPESKPLTQAGTPLLPSLVPDLRADELAELESEGAPAAEIPSTLLRDYEKADPRPGVRVAVSLVIAAVLVAGGLWWVLHSKSANSAAAAVRSQPAHVQGTSAIQQAGSQPADSSAAPVQSAADLLQQVAPDDAKRNVLPLVTGIRHWESGDSTTVVIDLQDQVQYEVHRLSSPERIYFDLHDTVLAPGLSGKTIEVGDALLIRIRVAQPVPGVSRVVLETKDVSNFSVSLSSNPYRLVAEVRAAGAESRPNSKIDLLRPSIPEQSRLTSSLEQLSKEDQQLRARVPQMRIAIDAGHGGWDLGTVGRKGLLEKNLVLDIARRLGSLLQTRLGTEVLYTREGDSYVPLEKRAEIANGAQADLFVSIHANYSDYPSARGVETYYTSASLPADSLDIEKRENGTAAKVPASGVLTGVLLQERTEQSRRLAASVERALHGTLAAKSPGIRDRGVKEAAFVVLTATSMPAILAEVSFVSSPADEIKLKSAAYRQHIAEALYKGIARYSANSSRVKMASASAKPTGK